MQLFAFEVRDFNVARSMKNLYRNFKRKRLLLNLNSDGNNFQKILKTNC